MHAKGLTPGASYNVKAYPLSESSDYGSTPYVLGTLTANGEGEGEIHGFLDLPGPAGYEWEVTVESAGVVVLQTHPMDAAGFFVIS